VREQFTLRVSRFIVAMVCLSLLVACGSDAVHGDEAVLVGAVYLDCSEKCKEHGSCGSEKGTGREMVLLGALPAFPVVSAVAFEGMLDGAAVEVEDTRVVAGIEQNTGEEVQIRFYRVQDPAGAGGGWTPGFCIADVKE